MKKFYIFVDDEREYAGSKFNDQYVVIVVRTYEGVIGLLDYCVEHNIEVLLDLDHDLGTEKTGYDICKYIVENNIRDVQYRIHSMNPVGRDNMEQLMSHYGYRRFSIV